MTVFILTFLVMVSVVVAMSVGVLMGRKPIKGSCGGMSALGVGTACDICGGDTSKCEENQEQQSGLGQSGNDSDDLAYNAAEDRSER